MKLPEPPLQRFLVLGQRVVRRRQRRDGRALLLVHPLGVADAARVVADAGALRAHRPLKSLGFLDQRVRRVDGRWKWERIVYGPDPNGLRYISSGVSTIIIALLFAAISAAILWPDVVTETVMTIVVIVLMIPLCVTYCIVENKLRKLL